MNTPAPQPTQQATAPQPTIKYNISELAGTGVSQTSAISSATRQIAATERDTSARYGTAAATAGLLAMAVDRHYSLTRAHQYMSKTKTTIAQDLIKNHARYLQANYPDEYAKLQSAVGALDEANEATVRACNEALEELNGKMAGATLSDKTFATKLGDTTLGDTELKTLFANSDEALKKAADEFVNTKGTGPSVETNRQKIRQNTFDELCNQDATLRAKQTACMDDILDAEIKIPQVDASGNIVKNAAGETVFDIKTVRQIQADVPTGELKRLLGDKKTFFTMEEFMSALKADVNGATKLTSEMAEDIVTKIGTARNAFIEATDDVLSKISLSNKLYRVSNINIVEKGGKYTAYRQFKNMYPTDHTHFKACAAFDQMLDDAAKEAAKIQNAGTKATLLNNLNKMRKGVTGIRAAGGAAAVLGTVYAIYASAGENRWTSDKEEYIKALCTALQENGNLNLQTDPKTYSAERRKELLQKALEHASEDQKAELNAILSSNSMSMYDYLVKAGKIRPCQEDQEISKVIAQHGNDIVRDNIDAMFFSSLEGSLAELDNSRTGGVEVDGPTPVDEINPDDPSKEYLGLTNAEAEEYNELLRKRDDGTLTDDDRARLAALEQKQEDAKNHGGNDDGENEETLTGLNADETKRLQELHQKTDLTEAEAKEYATLMVKFLEARKAAGETLSAQEEEALAAAKAMLAGEGNSNDTNDGDKGKGNDTNDGDKGKGNEQGQKTPLNPAEKKEHAALQAKIASGQPLTQEEAQRFAELNAREVANTQQPGKTTSQPTVVRTTGNGSGSGRGTTGANGKDGKDGKDSKDTTNGANIDPSALVNKPEEEGFWSKYGSWILIAVATLGVGALAYFFIKKYKDKSDDAKKQTQTLQSQVTDLESQIETLTKENEASNTTTNSQGSTLANSGTDITNAQTSATNAVRTNGGNSL